MFDLKPVDESFFSSAPTLLVGRFQIDRPAAEVWADMVEDHPLGWCRIIGARGIEWTSPRPFGVGTKRTVSAMKGLSEMREHYFIWEEGSRKAFYVERSSTPMFKRFAEDYRVEPQGKDTCLLTWTVAFEPTLLGRGPVNRKIMQTMFTDTRKHYGATE